MKSILYLMMLMLFSALPVAGQGGAGEGKPVNLKTIPTVSYCELASTPEAYEKKIVRVKGIYLNLVVGPAFYDPACGKGRAAVSFTRELLNASETTHTFLDDMREALTNKAGVTVTGEFYGPRRPASDWNYGHYGMFKYKLVINSVEEAKPLPRDKSK